MASMQAIYEELRTISALLRQNGAASAAQAAAAAMASAAQSVATQSILTDILKKEDVIIGLLNVDGPPTKIVFGFGTPVPQK